MPNLDFLRKNTPETKARTQAEKLRQVLALQEAILLEQKARLATARAEKPASLPQDQLSLPQEPIAPFDPNKLFKEAKDNLPF